MTCSISAPPDLVLKIDEEARFIEQNKSQFYVKLLKYGYTVYEKTKNEGLSEESAAKQTIEEELALLKEYDDARKGSGKGDDVYNALEVYLTKNFSRESVKLLADVIKVISDTGNFQVERDQRPVERPFTLTV
ncbi:MAG: hypothetical protein QXE84_02065 [Candidatus Nitrosotenuis sp.]|nr:hypothetical protein [Candidatus Nitrosotenuis uzonensis]